MPHKSAVHTKEKARLSKTTSECNVNVFKESNYYSSSVNMNASSSLMTAYAVTALLFGVKKKTHLFLAFALYIFFFLFELIQCTFLSHILWYTHSLSAVIEILIGQAMFFFFFFFCPLIHKSPLIKMFKFAPASRKSDPCKLRGTLENPVEFAIIHTRYVSLPYLRDPPLHSCAEGSEVWHTDRMQNIYMCVIYANNTPSVFLLINLFVRVHRISIFILWTKKKLCSDVNSSKSSPAEPSRAKQLIPHYHSRAQFHPLANWTMFWSFWPEYTQSSSVTHQVTV